SAGARRRATSGAAADAIEVKDYNDPAMMGKLGVFGYNRMTPLKKIEQGRGLSNTVFMIRVPHDGTAGITPWMAGGGSTIRTVPETNSLEPFLSTEANGDRGTYVVMCDGSVRYLKKGMSDEVFKAICTVEGPTPTPWSFDDDFPPNARPKVFTPGSLKGKVVPPP